MVRNIKTNDLYLYLGENNFRNLRTGTEGIVSDEIAAKMFVINLEATALIGEHPMIENLIRAFSLKFCKDE